MKLLLDEMFSPAIARELRTRGHDAEAVSGRPEWEGLSDPDVVEVARREQRAIVTNNLRDFRPLHHEALAPGGRGHFGMVVVPADIGRLISALEQVLVAHPGVEDLANGETWVRSST